MIEFWNSLNPLLQMLIKGLAVIGVIFPLAGASSLAERKVSAWIQGRPGPNRAIPIWFAWVPVIGPFLQRLGVFHLMSDGAKMLFKEDPVPGHVNKFYFLLAPVLAVVPAFTTVAVVPFGAYINDAQQLVPLILSNVDIGILAVFAVGSLSVYSLIVAGWASNSKYPFLGGVRASAQLISYELSMTLAVIPVFLWINEPGGEGTLSLFKVVQSQTGTGLTNIHSYWFGMWMPLSAIIFLIALYAETNRQPFDMPESEADLVGGFHTEYGAFKWSLFFVAEYSHMMVGSGVFVLLFCGGWNPLPWVPLSTLVAGLAHLSPLALNPIFIGLLSIAIFLGKVLISVFVFMWVRWTLPRFRYDQVMKLGWQKLLPLAIGNLIVYALVIAWLQTRS